MKDEPNAPSEDSYHALCLTTGCTFLALNSASSCDEISIDLLKIKLFKDTAYASSQPTTTLK
jgi:hypothetical protein